MSGVRARQFIAVTAGCVLASVCSLSGTAFAATEPEPTTSTSTSTTSTSAPESAPAPDTQPQIVGGVSAPITTYPWLAAILKNDLVTNPPNDPFQQQFCGGALIHAEWVLTAAHCITNWTPDLTPAQAGVVFGRTDLDTITPGDRRVVDSITLHPSYVPATSQFDLALLHLSVPALGIPTAAYATDTSSEGLNQAARIMGWGAIDSEATFFLSTLKAATIKVLAPPPPTPGNTVCGTRTVGVDFFPANQICAGATSSGGIPDNCVFDDGGPLVVGNAGGWKIIGVTTDDGFCGSPGSDPSLYARVSAASAWIDSMLPAPPSNVGTFHPIAPARLVDTRKNTGKLGSGKLQPQWTITPQATGFVGIPNDGSVFAVVVNVTANAPTAAGWLTLYPTGSPLPTASNLNFVAGQTVPNLVTVQLGQVGKFSVGNTVGSAFAGQVHVIIDVVGYFTDDTAGAGFNSLAPRRILDTRPGKTSTDNPTFDEPVVKGSPILPEVCNDGDSPDIPVPDTASAVVVNATVVSGSTPGWLTLWPTGTAPTASNLNFSPNQTIANLVTVKVGPDCTIKVGNTEGGGTAAPVHVVLDLVGYYGPLNDGLGAEFHAMAPQRVVDTRPGKTTSANPALNAIIGPSSAVTAKVRDYGGTVPTTAVAVIANLTATGPTAGGWFTLWPTGPVPIASNLNFLAGQTVPNLAIVLVHTDGTVQLGNTMVPTGPVAGAGSTHGIIDLMGWYEPPPP